MMSQIYYLVRETLKSGYMSLETENQLKELVKTAFKKNEFISFEALIKLQQAVEDGWVKREAIESIRTSQATCINS